MSSTTETAASFLNWLEERDGALRMEFHGDTCWIVDHPADHNDEFLLVIPAENRVDSWDREITRLRIDSANETRRESFPDAPEMVQRARRQRENDQSQSGLKQFS